MTNVPDWAGDELRRNWPTLSEHDRLAIIGDREISLLRTAAVQMRGTELDRTEYGGDFTLDGLQDDYSWHAVAFGAPWNGWAAPIITVETLQNLIDDLAELDGQPFGEIQAGGALLVYGEGPEDYYVLSPNDRGEYALHSLGWCFLA